MFGYKTGAKQEDVNSIRRLTDEGKSPEEISRALMIVLPCVQSFAARHRAATSKHVNPEPVVKAEEVNEVEPVQEADEEGDQESAPRRVGRPKKQVV